MLQVGASVFSILLSLVSFTVQDIEKSFLLNDAGALHAQLARSTRLSIYLPEPLSYSDEISDAQAYFLFQRIFRRYTTLEFVPEQGFFQARPRGPIIVAARWSFADRHNNNRYVLRLFFLLQRTATSGPVPSTDRRPSLWRIAEIKAEKI